jgi:hypothetical protein
MYGNFCDHMAMKHGRIVVNDDGLRRRERLVKRITNLIKKHTSILWMHAVDSAESRAFLEEHVNPSDAGREIR